MNRIDGRAADELRPVNFESNFIIHPEGSVLATMGNTKVLCNVSIEEKVPGWMLAQGVEGGWVTAEYAMLPRSTHTRNRRETNGPRGRTQEISRLIGRALRASVDLTKLGERSCTIDCDVLQADGGTRTAAISGAYVALAIALHKLIAEGKVSSEVLLPQVAAISVGIVSDTCLLDLCYEEDVKAEVDANVVMTADGNLVEFQGTAEGVPFSREQCNTLLDIAEKGISKIVELQNMAISASLG